MAGGAGLNRRASAGPRPIRRIWAMNLLVPFLCGTFTVPAHTGSPTTPISTGSWGGEHIRLVVSETGATLEYDCAAGTIDEPLRTDKEGNFDARGAHVLGHGGPRELGDPPPRRHPARYHGWTDGKEMRLTVTVLETGDVVGTFTLGFGRQAHLERCM